MSTQMNKKKLVSEVMLSVEMCPVVSENVILKSIYPHLSIDCWHIFCFIVLRNNVLKGV